MGVLWVGFCRWLTVGTHSFTVSVSGWAFGPSHDDKGRDMDQICEECQYGCEECVCDDPSWMHDGDDGVTV